MFYGPFEALLISFLSTLMYIFPFLHKVFSDNSGQELRSKFDQMKVWSYSSEQQFVIMTVTS